MDVDLILKIAGIGIIVAVINLLLAKSGRDEQALMTTLAGIIVVLLMLVPQMGGLINTIKDMFGL
ncbi:MAG: stage III sporulation protein AC [Clostridia bacterium]|nr:stage III sporulation protein AC [Clostridia bacterium]